MADLPVKVPKELLSASPAALEGYVHSRLAQFVRAFGVSLAQLLPGASPALLDRAVHDTLRALPPPEYGQVPLEQLQLQLVFRHDCQALGCLEPQCPLCQHNSKRRCTVNFCKKYLVNDRMLARCGAQIRIEVIDRATGRLCDSDLLSDIFLEVFILNGATYDQRFLDAIRTSSLSRADSSNPDSVVALNADLDDCALLTNNKGKPLLASLAGGKMTAEGRLLIQAVRGRVVLPDLAVTNSSEALLSGRKPPFRLVVRAKHKRGQHISLRPAVSEAFVVATRRVKTSHKADIPTVDDSIAKLMHMGRETCRKLADLHSAAQQANMELDLDEHLACVEKVADFKALALRAETDSQLRQALQTLLKLPKDKWEESVAHAKCAVFPDSRPRAWFADRAGTVGLLFSATLGVVDLKRPAALLQRVLEPNGTSRLQIVQQPQQTPVQLDAVRQMLPQAEDCWWAPGHIGWALFDPQTGDAVQAPHPTLSPLPATAAAAGKGLLVPSPAAAAGAASPGMPLSGLQQQQQYAAANIAAATAAMQGMPQAAVVVVPPVPELSTGMGPPQQQQQQQPTKQEAMQMVAAAAPAAAGGGGGSAMPAQSPLQETPSSSAFRSPGWVHSSTAAHSPMHTQAQQQQQQQQMTAVSPHPPDRAAAPGSNMQASPAGPAIPSAFAALAAQPIAANDSPHEGTPPAAAGASPAAAAAAGGAPAAGTLAAAAPARGAVQPGASSSGLSSIGLQQSRSSGVSWLPPLSGRKRSLASAAGPTDSISERRTPSNTQPQPPAAAAAAPAGPGSQLSADMERFFTAAGFHPSPSLSAFPSMGLFVDTVGPAAAAGGGAGASLLRPSGAAAAAPTRTASAGLSRLLSLDLASLLRGTSMFPAAPPAGPAPPGMQAGGDGEAGVSPLAGLNVGIKVEDDGLCPTPHAAAAAAGLMALGSLPEPMERDAAAGADAGAGGDAV